MKPTEVAPEKYTDDRLFIHGIEVDVRGWEIRPIHDNLLLFRTLPLVPEDQGAPYHKLIGSYQAWPLPMELTDTIMVHILRWEIPVCRDPSEGWNDCFEWALRVGCCLPPRYLGAYGDSNNPPFNHLVTTGNYHAYNYQNTGWRVQTQQLPSFPS